MGEILFYDEWSKLLKEDCSIETINKCPNKGYWSIENIGIVLNKNIKIVEHIPKSILYSDRVVNAIVERFPTKVIELPKNFTDKLSDELLCKVILKHGAYKDTYISRINGERRKKRILDMVKDNKKPNLEDKEKIDKSISVATKMVELKKKMPNTINVIVDVMDKLNDNPKQGEVLLKQLVMSADIYNNDELEMKSLEYLIKKEKTTADLLLESIK